MVVLIILLALILLVFFVPYGIDVSFEECVLRVKVAAGPIRIQLFPRKPKTKHQLERERHKKEKKEKKAAAKKAQEEKKKAEKPAEQKEETSADETVKVKKERRLDFETLMALLEMALHALRRLFRSFSVDYFKLHCVVAGGDPYNTAMVYGYLCSAVEALPGIGGEGLAVFRRDISVTPDFMADKPEIAVRIVITLQLFKIVHLAVAFIVEFIAWKLRVRREKKAAAIEERTSENGRQQVQ